MIKTLHFCESCRKQIPDVSDIHFVEDKSDRGFCSEACILNFYRPYMQAFEKEEAVFKQLLSLPEDEGHNEILVNQHYLNLALNNPHEVWLSLNDLDQKFYTHILEVEVNGNTFYFILICSYIDGEPSFVFYRTLTGSIELLNKYRRDHMYQEDSEELEDNRMDIDIPEDIIEEIELKKSSFLAHILQLRIEEDISLERFVEFDKFLEPSLTTPDEIYEYQDDDGDTLLIHIKSFNERGESFFYVVAVINFEDQKVGTYSIPILGFPSIDKNLYKYFAVGKRLNETLKN